MRRHWDGQVSSVSRGASAWREGNGGLSNIRRVSLLLEPSLLLLQGSDAIAELVERTGNMAVLRVVAVAIEVEGLGTLALQQRQLDMVGEEEQLVWIRHGGRMIYGFCPVWCPGLLVLGDGVGGWGGKVGPCHCVCCLLWRCPSKDAHKC